MQSAAPRRAGCGGSAMSTIWERYQALPRRQRVLFGVVFMLGGSIGLWLEERTQILPTSWLPDDMSAGGHSSRPRPTSGAPS